MPIPPRPLPDDLGEVFTVSVAQSTGVSRARLRAQDLGAPHRGVRVRVTDAEASVDQAPLARDRAIRAAVLRRIRAYELVRRPHAFYTGRTAVAIYDRLFDDDDGSHPLDVAMFAPARAPRMTGVRGRQALPRLVTVREVDGMPVASPASVWASLGPELNIRDLVRLGDAFVRIPRGERGVARPGDQLATIDQLHAAALVPRRAERKRLEQALEDIRVGSMSPLETDFRVDARTARLPEPELDVEIRSDRGRLLGIADATFARYRVLVEVEGKHHLTSERQWERDIEKLAAFAAEGWEVVRLTGRRVRGGRSAEIVATALRRHGWTG